MTEAELEREERRAMEGRSQPQPTPNGNPHGTRTGATRAIRGCLAGGRRYTARDIARLTGLRTRDVQQIVCKGQSWLGRERKHEDAEYVYFIR